MRRPCRALRTAVPSAAIALAALASCLSCGGSANAEDLFPFDSARAWKHLETVVGFGERRAGSEGLRATREYLLAELESYGLQPVLQEFRAETPKGEIDFANVYADIGPPEASLVILCTHIDTKIFDWKFLGANDSGSGTAVLLELARCLAKSRADGPVGYRVLFLDGEESIREKWEDPDNRYGSRHHVAELRRTGELERVKACVLLDLIGDRDLVLTTETYSDTRLRRIFFDAARAIGLGEHVGGPSREILDDHLSFMAADIPSVDLIDYEYGPNNAYWHDPRDTLEHVSQESLDAIGRIVLAGLPALEDSIVRR